MAEKEINEAEIEAFVGPIKELALKLQEKKVVVVGVGEENEELATTLYYKMGGSAFSEFVVEGHSPTFDACMYGVDPDIVVIVTNHLRQNEESKTANVATRLLKVKTAHDQSGGGLPGTPVSSTDTLTSRTIVISTSGQIDSESMRRAGGGVVNFGDLNSHTQFITGLKKIIGDM